jgi:hypothetical protein
MFSLICNDRCLASGDVTSTVTHKVWGLVVVPKKKPSLWSRKTFNVIYIYTHLPGFYQRKWRHIRENSLLTPYSRVFLEKLSGSQLVKKRPAFYETRMFITVFTSARHLSLSWTSSMQSILPISHFLKFHINNILPSMIRSPKWSLSLRFPHQNPVYASPPPYALHAPPISFFSILSPEKYCVRSTDHPTPHYAAYSTPLLPRPS